MCSLCNKKLNRKLNTLKCCSKYLHVCTPQFFSPSNWKVVALQTDTQTQRLCCLQWQPQLQNLKWRHFFFGGGRGTLYQSTLTLHSAKLFFCYIFGQCFYSNCPRTLCLNRAIIWGSFQKIPSIMYSLWRAFQAYFFSSETIFKGSVSLCEADEISRDLGKEGVGRSSCPQLLGKGPFS